MDAGIHELVQKILWGVGFMAIGGALAVIFFLMFAPSILGSKTIQVQLDRLLHEVEQVSQQLQKILQHLADRDSESSGKGNDSPGVGSG
jgi:hypothetical protein